MARLALLTPPTTEPVDVNDLRAFLRIDTTDENALLTNLGMAARLAVENYTGRALITQGWRLTLDRWPQVRQRALTGVLQEGAASVIRHPACLAQTVCFPRAPLITVDAVRVWQGSSGWVTVSPLLYRVDTQGVPGRLAAVSGQWLPEPLEPSGGIQLDFTAGYGATAASIPEPFRQAIRLLTALWFEQRQPGTAGQLPDAVTALLRSYRLYPF